MINKSVFTVLGMMSGTSLDGLDLALCEFKYDDVWSFKIVKADTVKYAAEWLKKLRSSENLSGRDLLNLHYSYGKFLGETARVFLNGTEPDCIASHGHTVFHEPENGMTFQLGEPAAIASEVSVPVVGNFRATDVALAGNGAPLVPIGDELLFSEFNVCVNLGGFANLSFNNNGKRHAFDVCPANMMLNYLSQKLGFDFDESGSLAREGKLDEVLLDKLNSLEFYHQKGAKSLGKEWFDVCVLPLIQDVDPKDGLRTAVEHISFQLANNFPEHAKTVLVTGGGAHNSFLIEQLKKQCSDKSIIVPEKNVVDYKEALIFAFLGVLHLCEENNVLASATGSKKDHIGGGKFYGVR